MYPKQINTACVMAIAFLNYAVLDYSTLPGARLVIQVGMHV